MKVFQKHIKNSGFLLISTTLIIFVVMGSMLISYQIIRGKIKQNMYMNTNNNILRTFTYDELFYINTIICDGKYKNFVDYLIKTPTGTILDDKNLVNENGYILQDIKINGSSYKADTYGWSLKDWIKFHFAVSGNKSKKMLLICKKIFKYKDRKIRFTVKIVRNYASINNSLVNEYVEEVRVEYVNKR